MTVDVKVELHIVITYVLQRQLVQFLYFFPLGLKLEFSSLDLPIFVNSLSF